MARARWPVKLSRRPRSVVLEGCQEVWLPPMAAQVFQENGEAKADALPCRTGGMLLDLEATCM